MATKVAIQYGIFTGAYVGRYFRQVLADAGYEFVETSEQADIIIAHSAGCFWLPTVPSKQRLMLIDPPYWPQRSIEERAKARLKSHFLFWRNEYPLRPWLARTFWGVYYGIIESGRTRQITHIAPEFKLEQSITGHRVLLVRNNDDDWLTPDLDELDNLNPNLSVVHLAGDHENVWFNPAPYVALLEQLC